MGNPKNFNLILRADTKYLLICNAISSDPKIFESTVLCRLQNTCIRELLMKMIMPVWDLHIILLPACLEQTNSDITNYLPRSSGIFGGSSSFTSP